MNYKVIHIDDISRFWENDLFEKNIEDTLNFYSRDGWRLSHIISPNHHTVLILERG